MRFLGKPGLNVLPRGVLALKIAKWLDTRLGCVWLGFSIVLIGAIAPSLVELSLREASRAWETSRPPHPPIPEPINGEAIDITGEDWAGVGPIPTAK